MENNKFTNDIDKLVFEQNMHRRNWLAENIVSIIAILIMVFTMTVYLLVLTKVIKTNESTTITILANVSNFLMLVLGFYFGSSKGSKEKDKQIAEMSVTETEKK